MKKLLTDKPQGKEIGFELVQYTADNKPSKVAK